MASPYPRRQRQSAPSTSPDGPTLAAGERPHVGNGACGDDLARFERLMSGLVSEYLDETCERVGRSVEDVGAESTIDLYAIA